MQGSIRINAQALPTLPFADASNVPEDAEVNVFGFPLLAVSERVQTGEFASRATELTRLDLNESMGLHISDPLNPGFAGGPVIDGHGNVVGIFSAERRENGQPRKERRMRQKTALRETLLFLRL